jgi:hypothetical protein
MKGPSRRRPIQSRLPTMFNLLSVTGPRNGHPTATTKRPAQCRGRQHSYSPTRRKRSVLRYDRACGIEQIIYADLEDVLLGAHALSGDNTARGTAKSRIVHARCRKGNVQAAHSEWNGHDAFCNPPAVTKSWELAGLMGRRPPRRKFWRRKPSPTSTRWRLSREWASSHGVGAG